MTWHPVCGIADIRVGEARAFELGGKTIAVYNVEGEFFATDDECTHEEASLAEGFLEDHLIECPLHGSQFDLRTGEVLSLPAVLPVKTYPVKVEAGEIRIEVVAPAGTIIHDN
jgi:nitrite reductase/ring-hydroxylating ferredoxin subunit